MQNSKKRKLTLSVFRLATMLLLILPITTSPLFGQMTPIDSLAELPLDASAKEKMVLLNRIEVFLKAIKDEEEKQSLAQQYFQIAITRKDSMFLAQGHYYLDDFQQQKEIQRRYGWHLDDHSDEQSIYSTLNIYHDKEGNTTFEEIRNNDQLFENNKTSDKEYNYDPKEVYWGKLILYGDSEKTDDYLFHFSSDRYFQSWGNIETWMIHANDSISYFQTGDQFRVTEKPIPSQFNMLHYTIQQNEKVVLYFRMEGVDEEKIRKPNRIRIYLLEEDKWPGFFPDYPFKGDYLFDGPNLTFATNVTINHDFYIDSSGTSTIEEIVSNQEKLAWKDASKTLIEADKVYWLRKRFYGSPYFNGEQILHVAPFGAVDLFSFDYVDSYVADGQGGYHHQRTGDRVPLKHRAYKHWANFIKLDIGLRDTLDLWIRMEGADARFIVPKEPMGLFHVDPFSLFPSQSNHALFNGLLFGIVGIQTIFFFLLFVIEKERIHFYFSLIGLGFFLTWAFNFISLSGISYELFPVLRDYQVPIYFSGIFLVCFGFLKFVETYFNYHKTSIYAKWVAPILIVITFLAALNAILRFQFLLENRTIFAINPYFLSVILIIIVVLIIGLGAALKAPRQKSVSKKFFFLAFAPLIIVSLLHLTTTLYSLAIETPIGFENSLELGMNAGVIAMLTLLALSIGDRTNRLKADKAAALQKNLDDQKEINQAISRFVPNEFLNALGKTNITQIKLGDTVQKEVTVFFSDIRNYTTLSEQLTPEENFRFVNNYNGRMGPIIQNNKGFVNQYLGDGIMAIFPSSPTDALRAAIEMQQAIQTYNQERKAIGKDIIKVGMGMHDGSLIMGITGDKNRLDATTISDSVNSASRIENLTKHYGASILLSEVSLKKLDDVAAFNLRYLGQVLVKGRQQPLKIYEYFDGDFRESIALKILTLATFNQGVQLYFQQNFEQASYLFQSVLQQHPSDATAKLFLTKAKWLLKAGVAENWTGIEMMEKY